MCYPAYDSGPCALPTGPLKLLLGLHVGAIRPLQLIQNAAVTSINNLHTVANGGDLDKIQISCPHLWCCKRNSTLLPAICYQAFHF